MKKGLRTFATIAALGVGVAGLAGYKAHSVRKDIIGYTNALLLSGSVSIHPESQCDILITNHELRVLCTDTQGKISNIIIPVETNMDGLGAEEVQSDGNGFLDPNSGILLIEGGTKEIKRKSRGISI